MKKKNTVDLAIGGQAVIEGVLMRNKEKIAIAVRTESGKIILKKEVLNVNKYRFVNLPFIRGIVAFVQMLTIGIKALTYSTNIALGEDEEVLQLWELIGMIIFTFLFAVVIFVAVPYVTTLLIGFDEQINPILFNLVDGFIKLFLFIVYVVAISYMDDIYSVFQYHGAEHKAVNCFEAGKKLTVKNVQRYTTIHPRCGTSFIVFVLLIGIFILSVIAPLTNFIFPSFQMLHFAVQKIVLFLLRIAFMLPIASVSYEFIKIAGKYKSNKLIGIINMPGMLIQKITTKEPDDRMVEVAIKSLKAVI